MICARKGRSHTLRLDTLVGEKACWWPTYGFLGTTAVAAAALHCFLPVKAACGQGRVNEFTLIMRITRAREATNAR